MVASSFRNVLNCLGSLPFQLRTTCGVIPASRHTSVIEVPASAHFILSDVYVSIVMFDD